ncbi:MAG: rhomboid family intramembrane serine protease [Solirubrobacteraceae bacterium]
MTPTSVGMRCPECSRERTKVRTLRSASSRYGVTEILIAINVVVFLAEVATGVTLGGNDSGWVYSHGALYGPALTGHNPLGPVVGIPGTYQYWRLLTSGFLHASLLHIAFNMFFLYFVGRMLEPAIGRANFLAIYFASLLAGSFGALLFQPDIPTIGASTACFGVFGALIVVAHARRIPIWQSGLGPTLLINLLFTLTVANISIGGHIGGLIGGLVTGWMVVELDERRGRKQWALAGCALVGLISIVGAIAIAAGTGLTPNGLTL